MISPPTTGLLEDGAAWDAVAVADAAADAEAAASAAFFFLRWRFLRFFFAWGFSAGPSLTSTP